MINRRRRQIKAVNVKRLGDGALASLQTADNPTLGDAVFAFAFVTVAVAAFARCDDKTRRVP